MTRRLSVNDGDERSTISTPSIGRGTCRRPRASSLDGIEGRIFMSNRAVEALRTALSDADFADFRLRRCRVVDSANGGSR
jgi:hypothetical protein